MDYAEVLYLEMLTRLEIDNIVIEFLNGLRRNNSFERLIRELDTERGNLRGSRCPDESEELAKTVITKLAKVQKRLVESTDLRQEKELEIAIELATNAVIQREYNIDTDYQANFQLSD